MGSTTKLPLPLVDLIMMYHFYSLEGVLEEEIMVRKHTSVLFIKSLGNGRVACSNCEALRILNVQTNEFEVVARRRLQGDIVLLPNNNLGVISENEFIIFDSNGKVRNTLHEVWTWFCNFILLADDRLMGAQASTVRIWNLTNGECEQSFDQPDVVLSVAVLPGSRVVVGSRDNVARVWNITTGVCEAVLPHTDEVMCLVPVSNIGLVSAAGDGSLRLWDVVTYTCLHIFQPSSMGVTGLVVLPGCRLACSSQSGTIQIWNLVTGLSELILQEGANCAAVVRLYLLLDGRLLSSSEDMVMRVWDVTSGECDLTLQTTSPVISMAQLPTGKMLCGTRDGRILTWH